MKFITVTDARDGRPRTVRADLILEMNTKEAEDGDAGGTFILLDRIGWTRPVGETPDQIVVRIAAAPDV